MTNEEINEAVARKLGKIRIYVNASGEPTEREKAVAQSYIPDYAGSISAAWEIVEHCRENMRFDTAWIESHGDDGKPAWSARFWTPDFKADVYVRADTAPMAICQAFLKLP